MKPIHLLCTDPNHPVNAALKVWVQGREEDISIVHSSNALTGGHVLFLVSCSELIGPKLRAGYDHTLVLHASDLPEGRGWSPYIWSILNGAEKICVTLLDAAEPVDSGAIWCKRWFDVPRHALLHEIHDRLFETELALMDDALQLIADGKRPEPQAEQSSTYWPRRTPEDSELDPELSISEQFDKMRLADPLRFPSFFRLRGAVYRLKIERIDDESCN